MNFTVVNYRISLRTKFKYLIVIGEWNDGCTDPKDHGGMDFTMGVCRTVNSAFLHQFLRCHNDHDCFLFIDVNVFHNTTSNQVLPTAKTQWSKVSFSFQFTASWVMYSMKNLASHLYLRSNFYSWTQPDSPHISLSTYVIFFGGLLIKSSITAWSIHIFSPSSA